MKNAYGIWPERDTKNAGRPCLIGGLPFPTPGHKICRSHGKVVIETWTTPDQDVIPLWGCTFLSWHQCGYALGVGNTLDDALDDLAEQCSTDRETLLAYCEIGGEWEV